MFVIHRFSTKISESLVNDDFIQYFNGLKDTHDKYRHHKSGDSTYEIILNNVDIILSELPKTLVVVRVNITNMNNRCVRNKI